MREHMHNNWPLQADCRLPDGGVTNIIHVPMAPPLSGEAHLAYIQRSWAAMPWELRCNPIYAMSSPYLDLEVEAEYECRRHSFFPTYSDMKPRLRSVSSWATSPPSSLMTLTLLGTPMSPW